MQWLSLFLALLAAVGPVTLPDHMLQDSSNHLPQAPLVIRVPASPRVNKGIQRFVPAPLQRRSSPANPNPTSTPSTSSNCPSHRPLPYQASISLGREMLEPVSAVLAVVMAVFVPHVDGLGGGGKNLGRVSLPDGNFGGGVANAVASDGSSIWSHSWFQG